MTEYEQDFTLLEKFVPDEVNTDDNRILKFMDGLTWRIDQHLLGNPTLRTYTNVNNVSLLHF